jgi:hypothetical protein
MDWTTFYAGSTREVLLDRVGILERAIEVDEASAAPNRRLRAEYQAELDAIEALLDVPDPDCGHGLCDKTPEGYRCQSCGGTFPVAS